VALAVWPLLCGILVFGEDIIRWVRPVLMPALETFQFLVLTSLCKTVGTVVGSIYLALGFPLYPLQSGRPAPRSLLGNGLRPCGYRRLLGLSMLFLIVSQYLVNRLIGLGFAEYGPGLRVRRLHRHQPEPNRRTLAADRRVGLRLVHRLAQLAGPLSVGTYAVDILPETRHNAQLQVGFFDDTCEPFLQGHPGWPGAYISTVQDSILNHTKRTAETILPLHQ